MPIFTPEEFAALLPLACDWAAEQEKKILQSGVTLTQSQFADASIIDVAHPELVRLLRVAPIPRPTHPALAAAAERIHLIGPHTWGLTLRYGIFIREDHWGERAIIAHELVHTMQYERCLGIEPFLSQYLQECNIYGYLKAPMELEAIRIASDVCTAQRGMST